MTLMRKPLVFVPEILSFSWLVSFLVGTLSVGTDSGFTILNLRSQSATLRPVVETGCRLMLRCLHTSLFIKTSITQVWRRTESPEDIVRQQLAHSVGIF